MKVRELKRLLADCDDDAEVVLAKDGEGNNFSPLAVICHAQYRPHSSWGGDLVDEADSELHEGAVVAFVLWPTN